MSGSGFAALYRDEGWSKESAENAVSRFPSKLVGPILQVDGFRDPHPYRWTSIRCRSILNSYQRVRTMAEFNERSGGIM